MLFLCELEMWKVGGCWMSALCIMPKGDHPRKQPRPTTKLLTADHSQRSSHLSFLRPRCCSAHLVLTPPSGVTIALLMHLFANPLGWDLFSHGLPSPPTPSDPRSTARRTMPSFADPVIVASIQPTSWLPAMSAWSWTDVPTDPWETAWITVGQKQTCTAQMLGKEDLAKGSNVKGEEVGGWVACWFLHFKVRNHQRLKSSSRPVIVRHIQ